MSNNKIILALLMAALASGAMSASASANPIWLVKGKILESSETGLANIKLGKSTIKWEDSSTKTKFKVECKEVSGEVELNGGEPGTDKVQELEFKECSLVEAAKGCKLAASGVTSEELPGWSTKLEVISGKTYDAFTGMSFSLIFKGCEKSSFSKTWLFRGTLKAEVKNETGKIKTIFPTSAVEGDTLKSEGAEALLSGEGELEEKAGGALGFDEGKCSAMPCYTTEAGSLINGRLEVLTTKPAGGAGTLKATVAGVKIEIECKEAHGAGWIENSVTTGMGLGLGLLHYLKCTVPKPTGGNCKIQNELVHMLLSHGLVLLHGGGRYLIDFYPDNGAYAVITVEGCTNTFLDGAYKVTGNLLGLVNNTNLTTEFSEAIGGGLKFGVNVLVYTDILKSEMLGGGGIIVQDGS